MKRLAFLLTWISLFACQPMEGGACVVDGASCFDTAGSDECRAMQGDVMYWSGDTCAERGYLKSCPGQTGLRKSC
jgi:hypothetical protein